MISRTIKHISYIGIYTLFIACSNSPEKTAESSTDSTTTPSVAVAEQSSSADTIVNDGTTEQQVAKTESVAPLNQERKPAETQKPFKKITGEESPTKVASEPVSKPAENQANENVKKGEMLISKSDCLACHRLDEKLVGPAYKEVAKKYEANSKNVNYLAEKVIKGGSGVWGEVYMAPHPSLSEDDAKAMAEYILSLK